MKLSGLILVATSSLLVQAQNFTEAISTYPQLSNFTALMRQDPTFALSLTKLSSTDGEQTVLVPSNDAFDNYKRTTGHSINSLESATLQQILKYHTVNSSLTSTTLAQSKSGVTVSTQLTDHAFNNRGDITRSNIKTPGQVVAISQTTTAGRYLVRQLTSAATQVNAGLASHVAMDVVDGTFTGGRFQIVDAFLTLPGNCTDTMSTVGLTSLLTTINRTNTWTEWNTKPGITCLAPDDAAFGQIGNIQNTAPIAALNTALDEHAIDGAQYLTAFQQGDVFTTDAGTTVTVKVDAVTGEVWFNDAKVIRGNLVVGNGVMHVIDKVLTATTSASNSTNSTSSGTSTSSSSGSATASVKPKSAGVVGSSPGFGLSLGGLLIGLVVLVW